MLATHDFGLEESSPINLKTSKSIAFVPNDDEKLVSGIPFE